MGLFRIFALAPQVCKSLSQSALRFSLAKGAHLLNAMGERQKLERGKGLSPTTLASLLSGVTGLFNGGRW
jgi:hypothetical protein